MSWLYSRALVAEFSAANCSAGEQFAPSSASHTPQAYLSQDRMTAFSRPSRFGMTFAPLTDDRGAELLTWYLAASHARTLAQPVRAQESTASEADCGESSRELSARYDRNSCSWRTHRSLWDEGLPESSVILPRWGSMRDGVLSEQMTLEHHTAEKGCGLWPTPTASEHTGPGHAAQGGPNQKGGKGDLRLASAVHQFPTPTATNTKAHHMRGADNGKEREARSYGATGQLNPTWVEKLMGWPDDWTSPKPISHVKMCFWLMGMHNETETGRSEVLRVLRIGYAAQEIQREIGRPVGIHEAALLLAELCEHENRPDEARVFMACAETLEEEMRGVWLCEGTTGTPHRPGQDPQRAGEHPDTMQALSRLLAHHGKTAWQNGSWEDAVPRVATGVAARVDRLKAIGNGQVPQCAAAAWRILTQ